MTPRSRRILANGLDHHVLEWARARDESIRGDEGRDGDQADAAGKVALLLHGFQDCGASFDLVAPALAERGFTVLAPDLRGFGDTERIGRGGYYHFADYLFDVADLVDAVSPTAPVFLVGHSMGGTIAGLFAGAFPERVALLALLEGAGPPESPETDAPFRVRHWVEGVRTARAARDRAMTPEEAARRLGANHRHVAEDVIRRRAAQLTRPSTASPGLVVWKADPLHRTTSPIGFTVARWRAHASRIAAPTLVVGGGPTGFHPHDERERIAAIPRARCVELVDAGHMMHWTQPTVLTTHLLAFADGV